MVGNDTTIGLSFEARDRVKSKKLIPAETYEDVINRTFDRAEYLESEYTKLKNDLELCQIECEGLKCGIAGKELKKAYGEAK
jgi:hypothetical protein